MEQLEQLEQLERPLTFDCLFPYKASDCKELLGSLAAEVVEGQLLGIGRAVVVTLGDSLLVGTSLIWALP